MGNPKIENFIDHSLPSSMNQAPFIISDSKIIPASDISEVIPLKADEKKSNKFCLVVSVCIAYVVIVAIIVASVLSVGKRNFFIMN